jgi:hypothetical protein
MPTIVLFIIIICLTQACPDLFRHIPNSIHNPHDSYPAIRRFSAKLKDATKLPTVVFLGDKPQRIRKLVPDDPGDYRRDKVACTYLSL